MRTFVLAFGLGLMGVLLSAAFVYWLSITFDSFDTRLLAATCLLPFFGIYLGCVFTRQSKFPDGWPVQGYAQRSIYALLTAALSALGSYLAFAISAQIWNSGDAPIALTALVQGAFQPDSLGMLSEESIGGYIEDVTWRSSTVLGSMGGLLVGFFMVHKTPDHLGRNR